MTILCSSSVFLLNLICLEQCVHVEGAVGWVKEQNVQNPIFAKLFLVSYVILTACDHTEVLNPQGKSISGFCSDVYSLGIVIWEIVTGQWPFHKQTTMQILTAVGINHKTPPIPEKTIPAIIIMLQRCWQLNPESRATMQELESYVTDTKEFNPDLSSSIPVSFQNMPAAEMNNLSGVNQAHPLQGSDCRAKIEPQNHVLADVPELGEAWPLESS